jgi:lipoyl synthase
VAIAKELQAPYELVLEVKKLGRLPVVNFAAGGIATPADASLMMQLGCDGIFVGSGIFKSDNPAARANVSKGKVQAIDPAEPDKIAHAIKKLALKHAVITSVTRDDLEDGGAQHFSGVIQAVKKVNPEVTVEVLVPDFAGNSEALLKVIRAKPEIINHNIETVPRLYPEVRPMADYQRSLRLLQSVKQADGSIYTKSGMMVGLGEIPAEVLEALKDLKTVGCDFLTIGQYLAPSKAHHPVVEYIHPDVFENYRREALNIGFKICGCRAFCPQFLSC